MRQYSQINVPAKIKTALTFITRAYNDQAQRCTAIARFGVAALILTTPIMAFGQTYADTPAAVTTTASLTPAPYLGHYSPTTTVTLATSGDASQTYYTIDGGEAQVYSAPFYLTAEYNQLTNHTLVYWSEDTSGITEYPKTVFMTADGNMLTWPNVVEATAPTICPYSPPADWKARLLATGVDIDTEQNSSWVMYADPRSGYALEVDINRTGRINMASTVNHANLGVGLQPLDEWRQVMRIPAGDTISAHWFTSMTDATLDTSMDWDGGYDQPLAIGHRWVLTGEDTDNSNAMCYYYVNNVDYDQNYTGVKPMKSYTYPLENDL